MCLDCNKTFDEPKCFQERHGLESPPFEVWHGCPYCSSYLYVEAIECDICHKYITDEYITTVNGDIYCENCYTRRNIYDS